MKRRTLQVFQNQFIHPVMHIGLQERILETAAHSALRTASEMKQTHFPLEEIDAAFGGGPVTARKFRRNNLPGSPRDSVAFPEKLQRKILDLPFHSVIQRSQRFRRRLVVLELRQTVARLENAVQKRNRGLVFILVFHHQLSPSTSCML